MLTSTWEQNITQKQLSHQSEKKRIDHEQQLNINLANQILHRK